MDRRRASDAGSERVSEPKSPSPAARELREGLLRVAATRRRHDESAVARTDYKADDVTHDSTRGAAYRAVLSNGFRVGIHIVPHPTTTQTVNDAMEARILGVLYPVMIDPNGTGGLRKEPQASQSTLRTGNTQFYALAPIEVADLMALGETLDTGGLETTFGSRLAIPKTEAQRFRGLTMAFAVVCAPGRSEQLSEQGIRMMVEAYGPDAWVEWVHVDPKRSASSAPIVVPLLEMPMQAMAAYYDVEDSREWRQFVLNNLNAIEGKGSS